MNANEPVKCQSKCNDCEHRCCLNCSNISICIVSGDTYIYKYARTWAAEIQRGNVMKKDKTHLNDIHVCKYLMTGNGLRCVFICKMNLKCCCNCEEMMHCTNTNKLSLCPHFPLEEGQHG